MDFEAAPHAQAAFQEVEAAGPAARPLEFPSPIVRSGVRVNALVVHPASGQREILSGVIHREELLAAGSAGASRVAPSGSGGGRGRGLVSSPRVESDGELEYVAYWPQRRLQDAIYGSVWACLVLQRHRGVAADDAARAAGVEPGSPQAPIVWEIVGTHVAIKMVEWARVQNMRGRLLEDPVKEIAAMQLLGMGNPHVLGSVEVLQDDDFLFSVMPYCRSGDLFGIVVSHAEDNNGEGGMSEPVARYWFRQILQGLHYLQQRGVCHRDLSLENILVDETNCLVIDMGMCLRVPYNCPVNPGSVVDVTAGSMRRLIRPQGVCGKHNYMSPEIFRNAEDFDGFAIDLWAAGVILYIMLTGFPPYDQASLADQRFEIIVNGSLMEQLENWDINLSQEAGDLMQNLLLLDPRDRLTLSQMMVHPWVIHGEVQPPPPADVPLH